MEDLPPSHLVILYDVNNMKIVRNILLVLIACLYLASSYAQLMSFVASSYGTSGPAAISALCGQSKDTPKKWIVPRRHLPLVKTITLSLDAACPLELPPVIQEHGLVHWNIVTVTSHSYYYSSLCDRAPPAA